MRQTDFTDEEILSNMKEILQNPMLRKCEQCANADEECTFCSQLKKPIAKWMYSGHCKYYETHEERIIRKTRENLDAHEKVNKRANYDLTMSLNSVEVAMFFMEAFEDIVEREYKTAEKNEIGDARVRKTDRHMISQLKKAYKEMLRNLEAARRQFNHFVMPLYNKVFFDKVENQYDAQMYDDHLMDVYEHAEVVQRYYDIAFENHEQGIKIREHLKTYPTGGVLEAEDYKKLNFKR
jgi:hypothetical protein